MRRNLFFGILLSATAAIWAQDVETSSWRADEARNKEQQSRLLIASQKASTPNQLAFDVFYYDLRLTIDPNSRSLAGQVGVRARVVQAPLQRIELDLHHQLLVSGVRLEASATPLEFVQENDLLIIQLDHPYAQDESIGLSIDYSGNPASGGTFGAFGFDSHNGKDMIWSLSEPYGARRWWPCKDYPADKADSVDIRITVPSHLIVASNGKLRQITEDNGWHTFWWHEGYPITTYLVSVAIHPYVQYDDWFHYSESDSMPVQFYVFSDHVQAVRSNYAKTVPMIKVFSDLYGLYPFIEEKYGHAEFVWSGGMEHQTLTSLGGWSEDLIAHELSHMWWGDMITCDSFHHIWLNEGFAVYSEALWHERTYGEAALHNKMRLERFWGGGTIFVENPETESIFDGNLSYAKASWVLHMLRHWVGDEDFFAILHTYRQRYAFKTATTEQFRDVCEEVSGRDLHRFFQQWIYDQGHPQYEFFWESVAANDGAQHLSVLIKQVQSIGPVFEMPIDIRVRLADRDTTFVVHNDLAVQSFEFTLPQPIQQVALDPDEWILRQVTAITQPLVHLVDFELKETSGDGDGVFERGEEADLLIRLQNLGVSVTGVEAQLQSLSAELQVVQGNSIYQALAANEIVDNASSPFHLRSADSGTSNFYALQLIVTAAGYRTELTLRIPVGAAAVLLVDDDDNLDYERYYTRMAEQADVIVDVWSIAEQGVVSPADLQNYRAVLWFTGDDCHSSLTSAEQATIGQYLSDGGRLLLSGQNIGFDLQEDGNSADSMFFHQVLHADYGGDRTDDYVVLGVTGDPVAGGVTVRFVGQYDCAGNQNSPSVIVPVEPAVLFLQYVPSFLGAGIRYEDPVSGSRLAYLAFGLEGIAGLRVDSAADLVGNILMWLQENLTAVPADQPAALPADFTLQQNFPNPFNPETRIRLHLPADAHVRAAVINLLGQEIRVLRDAAWSAGEQTLVWDGRDDSGQTVSAGIYLLVVRTHGLSDATRVQSIKMVRLP